MLKGVPENLRDDHLGTCSPEILDGVSYYDFVADWWALGIILYSSCQPTLIIGMWSQATQQIFRQDGHQSSSLNTMGMLHARNCAAAAAAALPVTVCPLLPRV